MSILQNDPEFETRTREPSAFHPTRSIVPSPRHQSPPALKTESQIEARTARTWPGARKRSARGSRRRHSCLFGKGNPLSGDSVRRESLEIDARSKESRGPTSWLHKDTVRSPAQAFHNARHSDPKKETRCIISGPSRDDFRAVWGKKTRQRVR